ncbi:MAG: NADP-dependent oxidoreductase [Burkholderiaceae bacterium]|nr:NADP-dependent oxidoreductase [Burkholderiaceae bacterium]
MNAQHAGVNRRIVLARRPADGQDVSHLMLEQSVIQSPGKGQFQIRHLYLALSPSARIRMSGDSDYGEGIRLGDVVPGQSIGIVAKSLHPDFHAGDIVATNGGWQEYSLSGGTAAQKIDANKVSLQDALGLLGTSGLTAFVGLTGYGHPAPGKTLVVSAASGSVGSVVGQIGRILGCRVVGITGGADKCRYVTQELGFDAAVDHRLDGWPDALAEACPDGIDIYFENVGGAVLDAVLPRMAEFGRVVLCGMISQYGLSGELRGPSWFPLLTKRLTVSGFLLRDHYARTQEYLSLASDWIADGKLKMRYDVADGLEQVPAAFARLLKGQNFGKTLVKLGPL